MKGVVSRSIPAELDFRVQLLACIILKFAPSVMMNVLNLAGINQSHIDWLVAVFFLQKRSHSTFSGTWTGSLNPIFYQNPVKTPTWPALE